ncbi:DUF3693 domain-containing protein [Stenotrophomonas sp.]|uniref:DUF3693 domain-containing protein n=1 Tax=Stenotrophomonas sp. TaxID=69392 RepID=UPI0028B0B10E|nr:DUF3693 domain-containing protein [Stenotrophomonas sp.]
MQAVNNLLDTVREKCGVPSDNALSKKIGVTRALVSGWRVGRYPVPDERIAQLCAMAKLDAPEWLARLHAERAESKVERAMWSSLLDRLSAAAAVVALVCITAPGAARAETFGAQGFAASAATHSVYYVKVLMARLARILPAIRSPQLRRNLAHA